MTKTLTDDLTYLHQNTEPDADFADALESQLRAAHAERYSAPAKRANTTKASFSFKRVAVIAASLVFVSAFLMAIPPVRTFAFEALGLFNRADSNTLTYTRTIDEDVTSTGSNPPAYLTLEEARAVVPFTLQVPSFIPEGYTLQGYSYYEDEGSVIAFYERQGRGLNILQAPINTDENAALFSDTRRIGADAPIKPISVDDFVGEYVDGMWVATNPEPDATDGEVTVELEWNTDVSLRTLRWIDDGMLYEVMAMGGSPDGYYFIGEDTMIEIALSME